MNGSIRVQLLLLSALGIFEAGAIGQGQDGTQPPEQEQIKQVGIQLERQTGKLDGTLNLPDGEGPFPVVIFEVGSGPTDRDGNSAGIPKNDSLKQLGQALAGRGIAVLRYDRRGIGKSAAVQPKEDDYQFDLRVDDCAAWVKSLRRDRRFGRIGLVGHSEGALVVILAAQKVDVDALVTLAGFSRPAHEGLREQLYKNLPRDLAKESGKIIDELAAGRTVAKPPKSLTGLFRPSVQPYLISYFKYHPAREIAKLKKPVLVVHGTTDLQHEVKEAKGLAEANKGAELCLIKDMNHVLKHTTATKLLGQTAAYTKASVPLAPGLVDRVGAFLQRELRKP